MNLNILNIIWLHQTSIPCSSNFKSYVAPIFYKIKTHLSSFTFVIIQFYNAEINIYKRKVYFGGGHKSA